MSSRDDDKAKVKDASPIERVIGDVLALKPKGRELVGLCPFHEDHRPRIDITWNNNRGKGTAKKSDAGAAKGVSATRGGASGGGNLTTRIELKRDRNISLLLPIFR